MAANHFQAQAVIDDIAAILIGEGDGLRGASLRQKLIFLCKLDRSFAANLPVEIVLRDGKPRAR